MFDRHKNPTRIPSCICVPRPFAGQHALDAVWTHDFDFDISSPRMVDPNFDVDMLESVEIMLIQIVLSHSDSAREAGWDDWLTAGIVAIVVHGAFTKLDGMRVEPGLRTHERPILRCFDILIRIKSTKTVLVAILATRSNGFPVVVWVDYPSGLYAEILNISPGEIWTCFHGQGEDPGGVGCCGRCPTMRSCAFALPFISRDLVGC